MIQFKSCVWITKTAKQNHYKKKGRNFIAIVTIFLEWLIMISPLARTCLWIDNRGIFLNIFHIGKGLNKKTCIEPN